MSDRDRVILITGASTGIGAATARMLASEGWRLVLAARSIEKLDELASELGGSDHAVAVECDVTDWADQQAAVVVALEHYGRLDATWANAGFGASRGFLAETPEHWREMVLTNVLGAALTIRAALPALKEAKGHLLVTGSVAGRRAIPGSLYSATKHAVHAMGRVTPSGARRDGVSASRSLLPASSTRRSSTSVPLDAPLEPDDIARAVLYALSQPPHVDVNEILVRPTAQPL